jgi:UDP-N-acetylmuramate dehydrogenase
MQILENCALVNKNTFHIPANARYWGEFTNVTELREILADHRFQQIPVLPVGGGSNLLFTQNYPGLLLHSCIKDLFVIKEEGDSVFIKVGSGVIWDDLVDWTVRQGYSGLENLSGIPGEVGASPVQNIGAYGAEAKDCIYMVETTHRETLEQKNFTNAECQFGYRDSIFKKELKNQFIVCYVIYKLSKIYNQNIAYGDLMTRVNKMGGASLSNVRSAILQIRDEKLPNPAILGNAGSFFMNPEIPESTYHNLLEKYPQMPGWPLKNGKVKISAAWCIDQLGWKGKQLGNAAVHDKQALVLVNPGSATASDIITLCESIITDVSNRFGIKLHPEVLFI